MLIGGRRVPSATGGEFDVMDPATESVIARVPIGGVEDVGAAVDAAEEALEPWASMSPRERGLILHRAAEMVRTCADDLAITLVREQGKPLEEAHGEMMGFANAMEFYASISGAIKGDLISLPGIGEAHVYREPLGVCAAIIPWNVPALIMAWKVGPALVTGNTLVLKPASTTPLTNLALAELLIKAGVPSGVINVVTGPGDTVGQALASHPGVAKISFTGDTATGRKVAEAAAPTFKAVTLELGGSDPAIVCDDVDIEKVASAVVKYRFYNCGQACTSLKRLYVMDTIADEFIASLERKVEALKMGNGMDPETDIGPLNNAPQKRQVIEQVRATLESDDGVLRVGGWNPEVPGHFYPPTLITEVDPTSRLLTEEVFGPVLPVVRVHGLEEAIGQANGTSYGLGSSIWTNDVDAIRMAREGLRSGMVWVNLHLRVPVEVPFGGVKASGLGREGSMDALMSHLRTKTVIHSR